MYAVVGQVSIDIARIDEAEAQLNEMVVPTVKGVPGFISGVWTHSADGKGVGIVTFATEADAKGFQDRMAAMPMPPDGPVTMVSSHLARVAATA